MLKTNMIFHDCYKCYKVNFASNLNVIRRGGVGVVQRRFTKHISQSEPYSVA